MDKTSREYAEKEAARITFEKAATISSFAGKQMFNHTLYNEAALTGYLTAIEETNAKGKDEVIKQMLEALERVLHDCEAAELSHFDFFGLAQEAIRKAKEAANEAK